MILKSEKMLKKTQNKAKNNFYNRKTKLSLQLSLNLQNVVFVSIFCQEYYYEKRKMIIIANLYRLHK